MREEARMQDPDVFVEDCVNRCISFMRSGVGQMNLNGEAVLYLEDHFRPRFRMAFDNGGSARWDKDSRFVFHCSRILGRVAARFAAARGSSTVTKQDIEEAREKVVAEKSPGPGSWCSPF